MSHKINPASHIELLVSAIMLVGVIAWLYAIHKAGLPLPW